MTISNLKYTVAAALCAAVVCAPAQSSFRDLEKAVDATFDAARESREQNAAASDVRAIFAKAKEAADDEDKLNLCGFYTGMSKSDATTLGNYYKLKPDELETEGDPVYEIKLSLKGLRRVTKGGNTFEELAQAVANRIGDLRHDYETDTWGIKTIDGIVVTMSEKDGFKMVDVEIKNAAYMMARIKREAAEHKVREEREAAIMNTLKNGKVQLWEDGPYWAVKNIGAEKPWESGFHFWWGDTVGYRREGDAWVASDGSSSNFSFDADNTPTFDKDTSTLLREGWIVSKDDSFVLAPEHDAAQIHWGGGWRIPTKQELEDLNKKCDWVWTTINGVNGYIVSGKGNFSSASIFLPAAGYGYGTSLYDAGSDGVYWSSVPRGSNSHYAWSLNFDSGGHYTYGIRRFYGQSVRPVQGFAE